VHCAVTVKSWIIHRFVWKFLKNINKNWVFFRYISKYTSKRLCVC